MHICATLPSSTGYHNTYSSLTACAASVLQDKGELFLCTHTAGKKEKEAQYIRPGGLRVYHNIV